MYFASSSLITVRNSAVLITWAAALFSALQIHHASDTFGHDFCGPWGCGPPVAALVGYHLFWMVICLPMGVIASRCLSPEQARLIGKSIAWIAVAGIALLVIVDGIDFFRQAGESRYLLQRGLFRLATFVDFPLLALCLSGALMYRFNRCREPASPSAGDFDRL